MKKIIGVTLLAFTLACTAYATGIVEGPSQASEDLDMSYAFGMVLGSDLKQTGLTFNYNAFTRGLRDVLENKDTKLVMDDAILKVQIAFLMAMEKQAEANKQKEVQFLEENGKRAGIITTSSGLQYEVINEGSGEKPLASDRVQVNYEGALIDGVVFDSSYVREEPVEFRLNGVIQGWAEGLQLMREGGTYRFYIPSELAYGEQGAGSIIPPYATLIFKVDLLKIVASQEEPPQEMFNLEEDEDYIYIPVE